MLYLAFFGQRGTPFIYQGEEIGMINSPFKTIDDYRDVEAINYYHDQLKHQPKSNILASLRAKGRDHARTPMQWDKTFQAGFTYGKPWLPVHPAYRTINVASDAQSKHSIQAFLKSFLMFRREHDVFIHGDLVYRDFGHPDLYAYMRVSPDETVLIITSFSSTSLTLEFPDYSEWLPILINDKKVKLDHRFQIPPFFGGLYRRKKT
jgi:glycosidase